MSVVYGQHDQDRQGFYRDLLFMLGTVGTLGTRLKENAFPRLCGGSMCSHKSRLLWEQWEHMRTAAIFDNGQSPLFATRGFPPGGIGSFSHYTR